MLKVQSLESAEVLTRSQLKNVLGGVAIATTTPCPSSGCSLECDCADPVNDWCVLNKCVSRPRP